MNDNELPPEEGTAGQNQKSELEQRVPNTESGPAPQGIYHGMIDDAEFYKHPENCPSSAEYNLRQTGIR